MAIHPIEYRYGSVELRKIFNRESWLKFFIQVELSILKSLEDVGLIPKGTYLKVKKAAEKITIKDIEETEKVIKHEAMAVVTVLSRFSGNAGKYVHLGATSNDILDTILGLQLSIAGQLILSKIEELIKSLISLSWRERKTPCIGRTHGRAAIPTTFGYRLLMFIDELDRAYDVVKQAFNTVSVGKYSGAVGTYAELGEVMYDLERKVMDDLGLKASRYSTQIVPRDRLAFLFLSLSLLSSILDQLGREIRNLQRSGIEEVFEPFTSKQIGSSVMPHKRNPIMSEKICGLSKIIRGLVIGALENIPLEHERDLTNSSFERVSVPEILLLVDEQLQTAIRVVSGLEVNRDNMISNIRREEPWIYSDLIVQIATLRGANRNKVHERIRRMIMKGSKQPTDLLKDSYIKKYITIEDINKVSNLEYYISIAEFRLKKVLPSIAKKYGLELK